MSQPDNQTDAVRERPLTPSEDRQWAFLAHCGGILGCIPSFLIYKVFGPRGRFTAQESFEALNFTLPPTIAAVFLNILALVFSMFNPSVGTIFALLALLVWAALTVFSVIAAIHVNKGQPYRYSMNLRLLK
ncbi:DUF4870 domain-containing protein [Arthrobacter antibioticus]|uniref:DUF4870 domain-containing protein n=1 Tax=Arthrobacter sp. H35-MC1 TaxID=3046203 RepID=UPI0024BA4A5C|nr:DUF4870 domain-containing protein [Arthrobacter sp. H35-MC1]MDJ0315884.1 DUF4870 domain-containing protein [Arthrobacter sp. H35-MC1]